MCRAGTCAWMTAIFWHRRPSGTCVMAHCQSSLEHLQLGQHHTTSRLCSSQPSHASVQAPLSKRHSGCREAIQQHQRCSKELLDYAVAEQAGGCGGLPVSMTIFRPSRGEVRPVQAPLDRAATAAALRSCTLSAKVKNLRHGRCQGMRQLPGNRSLIVCTAAMKGETPGFCSHGRLWLDGQSAAPAT